MLVPYKREIEISMIVRARERIDHSTEKKDEKKSSNPRCCTKNVCHSSFLVLVKARDEGHRLLILLFGDNNNERTCPDSVFHARTNSLTEPERALVR
jgi:hypothetical protein